MMKKTTHFRTAWLSVLMSFFLIASGLLTAHHAQAQLAVGDIAIIGVNMDGPTSSTDEFSIVTLALIPSGTTIYFSDYYWDNTNSRWGNNGLNGTSENFTEGIIKWTTTSTIAACTVFKISWTMGSGTPSVSGLPGTLTVASGQTGSTTSGPLATGDNIFIYQSNNNGVTPSNWIFGWTNSLATAVTCNNCWQSSNSSIAGQFSMLPTALTNGTSAISFAQVGSSTASNPSFDNNVYNIGSLRVGNKAALLSAICTLSNWVGNETTAYDISPTSTYFTGANAFSLSVPCTNPTAYTVTGGGAYCSGGSGVAIGVANSETGVTYQLLNGGSNVGSAVSGTGSAITFGNQTTAGTYTVVATRTTGGCTANMSNSVAVTVNPATAIGTQPQAQIVCAGANVTLSVAATGANLNYQWKKGAANVGTNANSLVLNNVSATDAANYSVEITGTCGNVTSNNVALTVNATTAIGTQPQAQIVCAGANVTLSVAATGANLNYQWKKGAANVGINANSLVLNNVSATDAANYSVEITGTCGNVTSNNVALTVNATTAIGTQPQAQIVCAGANVTLSVAATGANLNYQWKKGAANVGTNANSLVLNNVSATDAANYSVEITGTCGNVTSNSVALTVNATTAIGTQPQAQTVIEGANATFTVAASGTNLSYQWKKGAANVGSNSNSLVLNSVSVSDAGNYSVEITGTCGTVTSNSVALTVNSACVAPSIGTPPQASAVCAGSNASFMVAASGDGLSYQWKKGADNVGTNSATLNLSNVSAADAGNYSVVVTGICGNVTSGIAALTVNAITAIGTQPEPQTVTVGANVTFTVAATGSNLSYQWKKGAANVGTNSNTLTINNVALADADNYSVVVTGTCGNVTSNSVALTVNAACIAPSIGTQPQAQIVTAGANVTFTVAATGTNLSYQWKKGAANVGTNSNTLTINNVALADAGDYSVVITGDCGNATSIAAALTVNAAGTCGNLSFTIVSIGASVVDITWTPEPSNFVGYEIQWRKGTDPWNGPSKFSITQSAYRIPSLLANTTYMLRFRSISSSGFNAWETCSVTTEPLFTCNAPTVIINNTSASVVDISWSGENNTAGYEVQWQTGTSAWTGPGKFATSVTSYRIPSLSPNTTYNYRVRSLCTPLNEWTSWTTSSFTTAATFSCNAPTLTLAHIGSTIADVSWGLESNATNYEIQWQTVGGFWTGPSRFAGNITSYRIPDLLPNTTYNYRVRSLCSPLNEWTVWVMGSFTTKSSINCSSPTTISANATVSAIDLSWTATDSTNAYEIQWQSVGGLWNGSGRLNNALLASFRIPNLLASTTYNYRVRSRCLPTNEWAAWSTGNITTSSGGGRLGVSALAIHVYPNPSSGLVNVSGVEKASYAVFNTLGQQVLAGELNSENATLDLSNQANGMYLLKVVSDGAVQTKQVIINR